MSRLRTSVGGVELEHPVMNASGILGWEPEHVDILVVSGFSAIVTKTLTPKPHQGYPPPIIVELDNGGWLNAVGLANPGVESARALVERGHSHGKPVVVSVAGFTEDEFTYAAVKAEEAGADAIELNLSCPHVKGSGIQIGSDPVLVYRVVKNVTSVVKVPVIAKLGLCDRVVESASKAIEAGARALTLINTVRAMAIDVYSMRPVLSNRFGGLSGHPIKPIAVRVVYEVYRELGAEIIGCGGISSWKDAAEFILAGARALQVGTAFARNRGIVFSIVEGLEKWLETIGYSRVGDVVGLAHRF